MESLFTKKVDSVDPLTTAFYTVNIMTRDWPDIINSILPNCTNTNRNKKQFNCASTIKLNQEQR